MIWYTLDYSLFWNTMGVRFYCLLNFYFWFENPIFTLLLLLFFGVTFSSEGYVWQYFWLDWNFLRRLSSFYLAMTVESPLNYGATLMLLLCNTSWMPILVFFNFVLSPPPYLLLLLPFVFMLVLGVWWVESLPALLFLMLEFSLSEFLLSLEELELLYSIITFSFSSRIEQDSLGCSDTFEITDMWVWAWIEERWN